jgi:hypothetical protein
MKGGIAPPRHAVGVGAVREEVADALEIVPVGLAQQQRREAVVVEPTALDEDLERRVIVGFGRVVRRLPVVRIGAAFEQQARQAGVMGNARRAVQRALPLRLRLVIVLEPPGVRACAGVEQRGRRSYEALRSSAIEPEEARETEMRERIPVARTALRRRACRIDRETPPYGDIVAEDRRREDAARRDLGVLGQDRLSAVEPAGGVATVERHASGVDECADEILIGPRTPCRHLSAR